MRTRIIVAAAIVFLPAVSSAQRIPVPLPGKRGPGRPAELPPQPAPIERQMAYRRWRLSVESYPLVSYIQSPGLASGGPLTSWTSFGMGTRADYLLTRNISATLDLTSSFLGGPAITNTVEIGTRVHPEWAEHRLYPFADFRVGYISAYDRGLSSYGDFFTYPTPTNAYAVRYSQGYGGIAGVGMEYSLTARWTITTEGSVLRSQMTAEEFTPSQSVRPHFALTSFRYTLGIRYNPLRFMPMPGSDVR